MIPVENAKGVGHYWAEFTVGKKISIGPVQAMEFDTPDALLREVGQLEPLKDQPLLVFRQGPNGMCAVKSGVGVRITSATHTFPVLSCVQQRTVDASFLDGVTRFSNGFVQIKGLMPDGQPFSAEIYFQDRQ